MKDCNLKEFYTPAQKNMDPLTDYSEMGHEN